LVSRTVEGVACAEQVVVDQPSAGFAASVELVPIRKLVIVGVDELLEEQEIRWSWWPASWLSVETEHDTTVRPETPIRTSVVLAYGDVNEMAARELRAIG
jgi:hypothetical protein